MSWIKDNLRQFSGGENNNSCRAEKEELELVQFWRRFLPGGLHLPKKNVSFNTYPQNESGKVLF